MALITHSRVSRVSDGAVMTTVPFVIASFQEAINLIPAATRPARGEWGDYQVEYRVRYAARPRVLGRLADAGHLVLDVDFWPDQAALTGGAAPAISNTFILGIGAGWTPAEVADLARYVIDEYAKRAGLADWAGDRREHRIDPRAGAEVDPTGLLDASPMRALHLATLAIDTWRA